MLAWLPLQAGALPVLALNCEIDPAGSAMHRVMHGGAGHDHGGDADHDGFGHGCCRNLSSGAAAAAPIVPLPAGAVVPDASVAYPYRFFPDLPQRPPLANRA